MRISDWSSDVCSSDLEHGDLVVEGPVGGWEGRAEGRPPAGGVGVDAGPERRDEHAKGLEQPDEADDEDRAPDEPAALLAAADVHLIASSARKRRTLAIITGMTARKSTTATAAP